MSGFQYDIVWLENRVEELKAEIERLRSALHSISLASQSSMSDKEECGRIARKALATTEEK